MATPAGSMGEMKKGSWTPKEDLLLVDYVRQHGPNNWKFVPNNAGLRRSGKSCRQRWRNYLRPGIKRGNFSREEEKRIVNLQSVLGNKWSAIATYLPQRTDSDIKNHWNSHLKMKLQRQKKRNDEQVPTGGSTTSSASSDSASGGRPRRGIWESRLQNDVQMARQALSEALASFPAASSTATTTATVTPDAIFPQGVRFSAPLMATSALPSSAAGFMGGFKPPSSGFNRFTVTPAAIFPQGVRFSAPLMATSALPSSAAGFMGGFKPPSSGFNRFTVTPAAISPQGVRFSAPLMATSALPSSAAGFMGGFKPPSSGFNRFTNPITSNHQLSTGPAQIQGSPSHHVFRTGHLARLLQNRMKSQATGGAVKEASSPNPLPSDFGSLSHPIIPDPLDAIVGLNYGNGLFGYWNSNSNH